MCSNLGEPILSCYDCGAELDDNYVIVKLYKPDKPYTYIIVCDECYEKHYKEITPETNGGGASIE